MGCQGGLNLSASEELYSVRVGKICSECVCVCGGGGRGGVNDARGRGNLFRAVKVM